jgi:predicted dehydrogenase
MSESKVNRRDFVKTAVTAGAAFTILKDAASVYGTPANGQIQFGLIGSGGRGRDILKWAMDTGKEANTPARALAVSDVYAKRLRLAKEAVEKGYGEGSKCDGYMDYRELLERKDIDAVLIATPDHWHAPMAIAALEKGKDVYLEKPMTKTVEEARKIHEKVQETKRVLQVGSQTTSSDQWWKVRKAVQDGLIGKLIMSQGSFHRNSTTGEWNWPIDQAAGPEGKGDDYIDWKSWLGNAQSRPYNADRFFRFRKYWDYSGGIATDLFYHVMAPMNICFGEAQFPYRVTGTGGIYVFKDEREVPDTFTMTADYGKGHCVIISSSMANETHIPALIRGHEGTILINPNGQFEARVDQITITPQRAFKKAFEEKHGVSELVWKSEPTESHMANFFRCVKSRELPRLDSLTAYKTMTAIAMSVQSYREGRVLYFDEAKQKVVKNPPKA